MPQQYDTDGTMYCIDEDGFPDGRCWWKILQIKNRGLGITAQNIFGKIFW